MPLGPLSDLPKEAWIAVGVMATVVGNFLLGLIQNKTTKGASQDEAFQAARAELSSSQREFINRLQDEMSVYHAKMADMDAAYQVLLKSLKQERELMDQALKDERESCDQKMEKLQIEIDGLKDRMSNEESR